MTVEPPAISVQGVTKRYRLGAAAATTNSLREALVDVVKAPFRGGMAGARGETFVALSDVSFDVPRGEVVGVIGRNGAGKSTLLKVLARITEPSEGRIEMRGRAAALLEVGTGFHPELTGRENIYLNGTILGMRKREIDRKFDEIVAFAEVAQFIDTPVKRYSSGMYVRLAFGVAAHLDPEILIIDEVLAVGDAEFQRKCLGKMSDVASQGRTVLFVSHNMAAIRAICSSALLLKKGEVAAYGPVGPIATEYARSGAETSAASVTFEPRGIKPQFLRITVPNPTVDFGDMLEIEGELWSGAPAPAAIEVEIHDERGVPLCYTATAPIGTLMLPLKGQTAHKFRVRIGPLPLATGRYALYFWLAQPFAENYHVTKDPLVFEVLHSDSQGSGFEFKQSYGRGAITLPMATEFE